MFTEAFKELDLLCEEDFNLNDQNDIDAIRELKNSSSDIDMSEDVIDLEAETEEELQDSYIGKVILECPICHSKVFKSKDEVEISEEGDYVNAAEECPVCLSEEGFKVVGEVAPYPGTESAEEAEEDAIEDIEAVEDLEELSDVEEEDTLEESVQTNKPVEEGMLGLGGTAIGAGIGAALGGPAGALIGGGLGAAATAIPDAAIDTASDAIENIADDVDLGDAASLLLMASDESEKGSLEEGFEHVAVETEDSIMDMTSDENGKVTVTTEPKVEESISTAEEMIAPVSSETESEILANANSEEEPEDLSTEEDAIEEPVEEGEFSDEDLEEFDEESFDTVGESYLKSAYENVSSFKTTKVKDLNENKILVEGIIEFVSGSKKKTSFIFEAHEMNSDGKVSFLGENVEITKGNNAFSLQGTLKEGKFISESLSYSYDDVKGKASR